MLELVTVHGNEELTRRVLWSIPTMLGVLGTVSDSGSGHLMNISWVAPATATPLRLVASVESDSLSQANLSRKPLFTLSLLSLEQRALGRAFVKSNLEHGREDAVDTIAGHRVLADASGVPYLERAHGVFCGSAQPLRDLGSHCLWLLGVDLVAGAPVILEGSASEHSSRALGVFDTRMNYGR